MGRWSQRRRAGGGPPLITSGISITLGQIDGTMTVILTYDGNITAGDFNEASFTTHPSNTSANAISQESVNALNLEFTEDISTDTTISYNGSVVGVTTPQTIAIGP